MFQNLERKQAMQKISSQVPKTDKQTAKYPWIKSIKAKEKKKKKTQKFWNPKDLLALENSNNTKPNPTARPPKN